MFRSHVIIPALAVALAIPAAAQQLTEQEARQVVQASLDEFNKAAAAKDAAALAAQYVDSGIFVNGFGSTLDGQETIRKMYAGAFPTWDEHPLTLEKVKVIGNDVIVGIGSWTGTWHSDKGPVDMAGRWEKTYLRVGDKWKIAVQMGNIVTQK
jgi:uncharacterized protein (TIGR02246 family)